MDRGGQFPQHPRRGGAPLTRPASQLHLAERAPHSTAGVGSASGTSGPTRGRKSLPFSQRMRSSLDQLALCRETCGSRQQGPQTSACRMEGARRRQAGFQRTAAREGARAAPHLLSFGVRVKHSVATSGSAFESSPKLQTAARSPPCPFSCKVLPWRNPTCLAMCPPPAQRLLCPSRSFCD